MDHCFSAFGRHFPPPRHLQAQERITSMPETEMREKERDRRGRRGGEEEGSEVEEEGREQGGRGKEGELPD